MKKVIKLENIPISTVNFKGVKLCKTQLIWFDRSFFGECSQKILDKYSYIYLNSEYANTLAIDIEDTITLEAERYGGRGVGSHAGGVRSANVNGLQIKGTGSNLFLGKNAPEDHSYGGLDVSVR